MTPSPSVESLREIAKAHIGNGYSRSIEQLVETVLALLPSPEWKSMESSSAQSQPCGLGPADLEAGLDAELSAAGACLLVVRSFVEGQRITCSETIYQTDRVIENASEFIERLCDIAGYAEREQ